MSQTVTVSSNSADSGSGVASAQFQRSPSGAGTWTTIGTAGNSPYQVSWDTTGVSNGAYDLRVITTDNAGNTFTSSLISVTVSNTGPFVFDSFTDTTGTALDQHTGETGASWTRLTGSLTAVITNANRARRNGTGASNDTVYYASGSPPSANYTVQTNLYVASSLTSDWAGVVGRSSTSQATYYAAWYVNSSSTHRWELWKVVNGTFTSLGSYAQSLTTGQTYSLTLDMQGSTIRLLVDGTARVTATDSSISAAGRAGIYFKGNTTIDDSKGFQFADLTASI